MFKIYFLCASASCLLITSLNNSLTCIDRTSLPDTESTLKILEIKSQSLMTAQREAIKAKGELITRNKTNITNLERYKSSWLDFIRSAEKSVSARKYYIKMDENLIFFPACFKHKMNYIIINVL